MNNSYQRLIDGVVNTLRKDVLPRLDDDFVRGQTLGAIFVLNQLKARGDWSVKYLGEQLAAQRKMFEEVAALAKGSALVLPALPVLPAERPVTAGELEALREQGNQAICALLARLDEQDAAIAPEKRKAMETAIRGCMRQEIAIEMANTAKSMFAEISVGAEAETAGQKQSPQ